MSWDCGHDPDNHVLIRVGNASEGYVVCPVAECDFAGTWSTPRNTTGPPAPLTKAQVLKKFGELPKAMTE